MPKLKAPEGATNCSHAGTNYEVDTDGNVDVPDEAVGDLFNHGYAPADLPADDADQDDDTDADPDTDTSTTDEGAEADSGDESAEAPAAPLTRAQKRASRNR